jgi:hypothetical protein
MAKSSWAKFPHPEKAYLYDGANLKRHWDRLHRGDCEPFPKDEAIQEAWRAYHQGDFGRAIEAAAAGGVERGQQGAGDLRDLPRKPGRKAKFFTRRWSAARRR